MLASIGLMGLSANYVNNYTRAHNPGLVKGHLSAWPGLTLGTSIVTFLCATSMYISLRIFERGNDSSQVTNVLGSSLTSSGEELSHRGSWLKRQFLVSAFSHPSANVRDEFSQPIDES